MTSVYETLPSRGVPFTTLTMGTLSNEQMGRGTGIYNLTRNIGGSFGISMVASIVASPALPIETFRSSGGLLPTTRRYTS